LSHGEIIFRTIIIEVENLCVNNHRNRGFTSTVSEKESVFVGGKDGKRTVEGRRWRRREVTESEETVNVARIKDTKGRVLLDLDIDFKKSIIVDKEETKT
jgi:hypothetical protein